MFQLLRGMIGAGLIFLIPLAIGAIASYVERREAKKQKDHSLQVIYDHLENYLLDKINKR